MRNLIWLLALVIVLSLVAGCEGSGATATPPPTRTPQPIDLPTPTLPTATTTCLPANAGGTISPAIAICSITFVVNGVEGVVRDGDALPASRGDEVQVREVAICVGPFSGDGGEACVDLVPVDTSGREIASARNGTHIAKVSPGCKSIPGPDGTWTIGESWRSISVVLNHWPPDRTEDPGCAGGLCERDDRIVVGLQ